MLPEISENEELKDFEEALDKSSRQDDNYLDFLTSSVTNIDEDDIDLDVCPTGCNQVIYFLEFNKIFRI